MKGFIFLFAAVVSSMGIADVSGKESEVFGVKWRHRSFRSWVTDPKALITPEVSNLATQACLRESQRQLDLIAYRGAQRLVEEMQRSFRGETAEFTRAFDVGLSRLTEVIVGIENIDADGPEPYMKACEVALSFQLGNPVTRDELLPLFRGRLFPTIPSDLPPELRVKLEQVAKKGLRLSPLTWEQLVSQACRLDGYYAQSLEPGLWKLFSITSLLGNVLPDMREEALLKKAVERSPGVVRELKRLNRYSSVAGKYNGPAIGMSETEATEAGMRLTGSALGSRAHSFLGFFTTAWREEIQRLVIDQDYPERPFNLISSDSVIGAISATHEESQRRNALSQSEWGMVALWRGRSVWEANAYGPVTSEYRKTSGLAWLALNAESNVRQSEKIAGYEKTSTDSRKVTTRLIGTANQYAAIAKSLESAKEAFSGLSAEGELPDCVGALYRLNRAASSRLGFPLVARVVRMSEKEVSGLANISFEPVLVDIGLEVDDRLGTDPQGVFRLHLGTGHGREVEAEVRGESFLLWTPSSMVLHANRQLSTKYWQSVELHKYDPPLEGR